MIGRRKLAVSHALVSAQIALNAAVGYFFLKVLAARFGASAEKDIFDIAYNVPFIILNVGGFAFAHAVVTTYFSKVLATRPHKAEQLFATTATCAVIGSLSLGVLCVLFLDPLCEAIAPGIEPALHAELQHLVLLFLPIVVTLSLCTLFSAVCTAYEVPISNELGPLIIRVIVLVGLAFGVVGSSLPKIAMALTVSSFVGFVLQWIIVGKATGLRIRFSLDLGDRDFREMARQALGFFFVACMAQASMTYMRRLATLDGVGTNAATTYALSLLGPIGILVGKPLSVITGPQFARTFSQGASARGRHLLDRTIMVCLIVGFVGAILANYLAMPLVRLLYGGGQFDDQAARTTAELLGGLAWSLPGSIVLWVIVIPLVTVSRSHGAATIYFSGYLLQLVFMMLTFPVLGRSSLVWGYTIASSSQAVLALVVVYRALRVSVGVSDRARHSGSKLRFDEAVAQLESSRRVKVIAHSENC